MLKSYKSSSSPAEETRNVVSSEGLSFRVLGRRELFEVELLREVDAVILDCEGDAVPTEVIRKIRAHSEKDIYLKPVFLHNTARDVAPPATALTDGVIYNLDRLEEITHRAKRILVKIESFTKAHAVNFEDQVMTKLLRYLTSRGKEKITPLPFRQAKLGYAYPIVDVNYQPRNEQKGLQALEVAEEEGLLTSQFVDAWYVCSNCSEGFIHFREACPKCGILDLVEEDLIHHFRCAYVGPASDFAGELNIDTLICPKCEHQLNHIGVDYDRPSTIFTCRNDHTFQNPPVNAKCFTCGTETKVEHLIKKVFKEYEITPKGSEKALTGVTASVRQLNEIEGTVDLQTLKTMLQYEIERSKISRLESSLGVIHFANAGQLFSFIGKDDRNTMLSKMVERAREHLQPSDVLSFESFSTLVFFITSVNSSEAASRLNHIASAWKKNVAQKYHGYGAHIREEVCFLSSDMSAEEQLDALIQQVTK